MKHKILSSLYYVALAGVIALMVDMVARDQQSYVISHVLKLLTK